MKIAKLLKLLGYVPKEELMTRFEQDLYYFVQLGIVPNIFEGPSKNYQETAAKIISRYRKKGLSEAEIKTALRAVHRSSMIRFQREEKPFQYFVMDILKPGASEHVYRGKVERMQIVYDACSN